MAKNRYWSVSKVRKQKPLSVHLYSFPLTSLKVIVSINKLTVIPMIIGHSDVNYVTTIKIKTTALIGFEGLDIQ
jgi:hypothetical protein